MQVCVYKLFTGWQVAYASRAAERNAPMDKLPVPLHGVGACWLCYAVHCGTLFVFEVHKLFTLRL